MSNRPILIDISSNKEQLGKTTIACLLEKTLIEKGFSDVVVINTNGGYKEVKKLVASNDAATFEKLGKDASLTITDTPIVRLRKSEDLEVPATVQVVSFGYSEQMTPCLLLSYVHEILEKYFPKPVLVMRSNTNFVNDLSIAKSNEVPKEFIAQPIRILD